MKTILSVLLLFVLCGVILGDAPPSIPPAYWLLLDGVRGDSTDVTARLQEVLNLCALTGRDLQVNGVLYLTDTIFIPEGVSLKGNQTKAHFETEGQKGGFRMRSHTKLLGFEIDTDSGASSFSGHGGYGTAITIGDYDDGIGYEDVEIANCVIHGVEREDNANIIILGNSYNIHVHDNHFINLDSSLHAVSVHWGEPSAGKEIGGDSNQTTHPHNILIENNVIDSMPYGGGFTRAFFISGAFDVTVRNNDIAFAKCGGYVYCGDFGYRYANQAYYSDLRGEGIIFENNTLHYSDSVGWSVGGLAGTLDGWRTGDSGATLTIEDVNFDMPVRFIKCHSHGDTTALMGNGLWTTDCKGVIFDGCIITGHYAGYVPSQRSKNVTLQNCEFSGNRASGALISYSVSPPEDIRLYNCWMYNNVSDPSLGGRSQLYVGNGQRTVVEGCIFGDTLFTDTSLYGIQVSDGSYGGRYVGNRVVWVFDTATSAAYRILYDSTVTGGFYDNTIGEYIKNATYTVHYSNNVDLNTFGWRIGVDSALILISRTVNHLNIGGDRDWGKITVQMTAHDSIDAASFGDSSKTMMTLFNGSTSDSSGTIILFRLSGTGTSDAAIVARRIGSNTNQVEIWTERNNSRIPMLTIGSDSTLRIGEVTYPGSDSTDNLVLTWSDEAGKPRWETAPGAGSGTVDTFYVAEAVATTTGWKSSGDTIFIDTSSGGGGGGLDTTEVLDILRDSISGDATVGVGGALTVIDDLHDHVYSNIDATTSADWITRVSDETGTGLWVFGTSPTFTTDLTSPLVIGGTATTSDLSLKTTSGVGETGADMHFLVGNNGATEAVTILNNGNVGIKTTNPEDELHITGNSVTLKLEDDGGNKGAINVGNSQINIAIDPDDLVASSDICFDIDGAEVARFHESTNFGIGTLSPAERLDVIGNIAVSGTVDGVDVLALNNGVAGDSAAWREKDSAIVDFGGGNYKSSSSKAWSMKLGTNLSATTPTDSAGIDTFTVSVSDSVKFFSMTIFNPELVQDTVDDVPVFPVEAIWAPFGIKLLSVGIKTSSYTSAYSVVFEEWTHPCIDSGTETTIQTVATAATCEADSTNLIDSDIAAGNLISVDLPAIYADNLMVWGAYYIKKGD